MPTKKPNKTEEIIGKIFKDSDLVYGLKEFEDIKINDVLEIIEDEPNRFYLTDLKSGKKRFVYDEKKESGKPEEIVRQLWLYKLNKHYKYPLERIETEKSVHFGREIHAKAADLVVYKKDKIAPYIIVEVKAPNEKKGEDQLKTYLSAEGAEIGVWANGTDKIILYRPYPREYEALTEIPRADQTIDDLFEVKRKWSNLSPKFDFTKLTPSRLNICVPLMAGIRLFELGQGEYELVDQAFEHLITEVSKGRKGQYFTPRHAIKMCVQMLNPKEKEYIIDPACGSGGFMLHTMYHVWDNYLKTDAARKDYAGKYLYGIDFDDNMRRISQALMLIAGDGKHHIFKRDSLDSREWTGDEAEEARVALKSLLAKLENPSDARENQLTYRYLNFDIL